MAFYMDIFFCSGNLQFESGFLGIPLYVAIVLVYVKFSHVNMYSIYK